MSQLATLRLRSFAYRVSPGEGSDPGVDPLALAMPFEGERPSGESLRYEGTYDLIRAARHEEDPNLPQGIWQTAVKAGDWRTVKEASLKALQTSSKDLQLGLWLTESLARLHGFGGLACGLRVLVELCRSQWPTLHPELDDDGDPEARLNALAWLNESLARTVARLPLSLSDDDPSFSHADIDAAAPDTDDEDTLPRDGGRRVPMLAHILEALRQTPAEHLLACHRGLNDALIALQDLEAVLGLHLPLNQQPGFARLRTVLQGSVDKIDRDLTQRGISLTPPEPEPEPDPVESDPAGEQAHIEPESGGSLTTEQQEAAPMVDETVLRGPIRSRAEAFESLAEVADFLARTEPHSPVSYLLRRAIRWGSLPLPELLAELLEDSQDRLRLMSLLDLHEE
ncbi:type VI secretion system protein TssA [Insolitispirillum peregrinum]|uniref:Type VI secretion system protein ImpL/type VI secretion system protein ImpA n=1 Tax=Insolitispirillum peregrinum TaxID=80876 RepID=A0A1N7JGM4_9PROT|nr:type VI secretion system protein TssA [Insolitispirillum peregrinum]SIS48448.1 type VI secretion system protein ImpL/type VI secretion system protein ImpA [Insolitispirillum peregrinum]